ncbi:MAG: desulfoferrodoxin [Spirochaetales bacterium]|nr:desulfoferrodoxin [Spirochaetales bacterium]
MADEMGIYKCEKCGNIVEVVHKGGGALNCCAQGMVLMAENSTDAAQEKHVPVVEKKDGGWQVTVGTVPHPMTDDHYIEWIELIAGPKVYRQNLTPGDSPTAFFPMSDDDVKARAYCNLHGLWRS